jgi:hypothetical protein
MKANIKPQAADLAENRVEASLQMVNRRGGGLGLHHPSGGRAELFGVDTWLDPVSAYRTVAYVAGQPFLRRRAAVPVAVDDQRRDVGVFPPPARRGRRRISQPC